MNARHVSGGLSEAEFQKWQIRQFLLETETPGKFGIFGTEKVAA